MGIVQSSAVVVQNVVGIVQRCRGLSGPETSASWTQWRMGFGVYALLGLGLFAFRAHWALLPVGLSPLLDKLLD